MLWMRGVIVIAPLARVCVRRRLAVGAPALLRYYRLAG
jgi:hypothetical protein